MRSWAGADVYKRRGQCGAACRPYEWRPAAEDGRGFDQEDLRAPHIGRSDVGEKCADFPETAVAGLIHNPHASVRVKHRLQLHSR